MQLKPNTLLQGGKYRIIRILGQGGFGITYEAEQISLGRKVAVKEFFMKDCCERDEQTSRITIGTGSQRELVEKFRGKFIREARMIAALDHPHIVRVLDVFEENDTAYYVMENLPGGALADKVKKGGPLSEMQAEGYIRQVADALVFLHGQKLVHLDVKPSNILLNRSGAAVLIDFGISKHYDSDGEQTSSTPVGLSKGYAPLEQGRVGDVAQFTPATDIYALGATLYYLVTGQIPPEASIVNEDGLERPEGISDRMWRSIEKAMRPRRKDRPQTVAEFLELLSTAKTDVSEEDESTRVVSEKPEPPESPETPKSPKHASRKPLYIALSSAAACAVIAVLIGLFRGGKDTPGFSPDNMADTLAVVENVAIGEPAGAEMVKVTEVKLSKNVLELEVDGTTTLTATVSPKNATDKTVTWKSYDEQVATVSKTGKVTARKAGTAIIVARCGDQEASCKVTVTEKPVPVQQTAQPEKPQQPVQVATTGTANGHEWVDLGLSVKWATCNVGASSPESYGNYYAWGETSTKSDYGWTNYKFRVTGDSYDNVTFSKYNTKSERGTLDNKTRLDLSDDGVRQNWGGKWRTPTKAEWEELNSKCTWTWTTQGGKNGYKVTGKNGNSIFLPAAGFRDGSSLYFDGSRGFYWSSSLCTDYPGRAWRMSFHSGGRSVSRSYRYGGQSVRPVTE